jgi:hypothetical protein
MPRTAARFTQADIARALRAARGLGMRVRLAASGDIVIEPAAETAADQPPPAAPGGGGLPDRAPLVF